MPMQDEEVGQNIDHIDRLELAGDTGRQAFVSELVEHVEHPIPASVPGAAECTIHRPCDLTFSILPRGTIIPPLGGAHS
jgi:hypothetical protein